MKHVGTECHVVVRKFHKKVQHKPATTNRVTNTAVATADAEVCCQLMHPPEPKVDVAVQWEPQGDEPDSDEEGEEEEEEEVKEEDDDSDEDPWFDPDDCHSHSEDDEIVDTQWVLSSLWFYDMNYSSHSYSLG